MNTHILRGGTNGRKVGRRIGAFLALAACLLLLIGVSGCGEQKAEAPKAQPPREVSAVTLHPQSVVLTAELPGRTTASLVAVVRPQVAGIILERLFREGGEVTAGDVLYRIDPATYQAAYDNAMAALQKAEAAVPSSRNKAQRYKELFRGNALSSQDYEDAAATLAADEAAVASAKAAVQTARINLNYTKITAPISGQIDKSSLTPGALVTANQERALTTIRKIDPINVDVIQSSANLLDFRQALASGRIKGIGSKVSVKLKLENGTIYSHTGTLEFAEANVDEAMGTYTLRAEFPNPERLLLPGMYVRAVVEEGVVDNSYLIPQRALTRNAKGEATGMFVDATGKVEERILPVERNIGNFWLVESGVNDGDRIIVEGSQWVHNGQEVTVKDVIIDNATGEIQSLNDQGVSPSASSDTAAALPGARS